MSIPANQSSVERLGDVEFGTQLPVFHPNTELACVREFAEAVGWGGGRFDSHEKAKKEGLPGALVPGIMAMGFLTSVIHSWAPRARVANIDTVFRAPLIADEPCTVSAVVTDIDEDNAVVELDLTVKNDRDETRVFGTARVELPK